MKPICIIPARGGSKGVPGKNIRKISKIPLLGYVIQNLVNSKIFSHVIVSTENKKIATIAQKFGAEVPFIRPKYLATDDAAMDDVLLHAVKTLYEQKYDFDVFLKKAKSLNFKIGVFFINENQWFDIGQWGNYVKTLKDL